jgi:hypothetical protein
VRSGGFLGNVLKIKEKNKKSPFSAPEPNKYIHIFRFGNSFLQKGGNGSRTAPMLA